MTANGNQHPLDADMAVIGGGLAGLTAAATLAQAGRSVILLEKSKQAGGLAVTHQHQGVLFNLGPRALSRHGRAFQILSEMGVAFTGQVPGRGRRLGLLRGGLVRLPVTPAALVFSRILTLREKRTLMRLLGSLPQADASVYDYVALNDWIREQAGTGNLALLLQLLLRLATYADDAERMSAGAALRQLQLGLAGNVLYLDGGWQTLVDGLTSLATKYGTEIRTSAPAESVQSTEDRARVRLAGGDALHVRAAILAVPPQAACDLLSMSEDTGLGRHAARCLPVQAACLDVALKELPRPERLVVFGLDQPLYYSVHSAAAKLAPPGVAVIHVMKYLGRNSSSAEESQAELLDFLDRVQPGWQERVVTRRFLPRMTVAASLPRADDGGLAGRPDVAIPEMPNVFLAGDWVGSEGLLADAAVASGRQAAKRALVQGSNQPILAQRRAQHVNG